MKGLSVRVLLVLGMAASCAPAERPPPQSASLPMPIGTSKAPAAPPPPRCEDLYTAEKVQEITGSPYAFARGPFEAKPPELGLRGEVLAAYLYTTKEAILHDAREPSRPPETYAPFAIVVTRRPAADAGPANAEEAQMVEAMTELRKRRPPLAVSGGRSAALVHLPGMIFADWPRADGLTSVRFMWFGVPREAQEPGRREAEAWLSPLTSDFYLDGGAGGGAGPALGWQRILRALDACVPP